MPKIAFLLRRVGKWLGDPPSIEFYLLQAGADGHIAPLHTFILYHARQGRTPMAAGMGTAIGGAEPRPTSFMDSRFRGNDTLFKILRVPLKIGSDFLVEGPQI